LNKEKQRGNKATKDNIKSYSHERNIGVKQKKPVHIEGESGWVWYANELSNSSLKKTDKK